MRGAWEGGARRERTWKRRASQALRGETQGTQQEQRERGGAHELRRAHAATPDESGAAGRRRTPAVGRRAREARAARGRAPDLVDKNTRRPVKLAFQINNPYLLSIHVS